MSIIPGCEHFYRGKAASGCRWLVGTIIAYVAFLPLGVLVHIAAAYSAATTTAD